ncbi:MAG: hypothetical protein ACO1OB_24970 [Archangium sp.]
MNLSSLPEPLRGRVEERLRKKPELEAFVKLLLEKHANEPEKAHALLAELVKPNRLLAVTLGLSIGLPAIGLGALFYADHQTKQAIANGVSTTARVELMKPSNCFFGSETSRCLELKLRVFPKNGAPYDGSLTESIAVEWMPRVQPGSWLVVAVDKSDPQKLTLDGEAFQRPAPTPID